MNTPENKSRAWRFAEALGVIARCIVGGMFIYMGVVKALHPVDFLKLVREYDIIHAPPALNLIAAALPWFEVFCGLLLVAGIAVRGTALVSVLMLVPFTVLVLLRTIEMSRAEGLSLCAIKFDCGCGGGEIWICRKLVENLMLTLLSAWLIFSRSERLCLRHQLIRTPST